MTRMLYAVVLLAAIVGPTDSRLAITGVVTDSEGAAIAKARIFIHWDASSKMVFNGDAVPDFSVFTDDRGEYTAAVPAGFYDVFVSSPAFTPVASKMIVRAGRPNVLDAKLSADPLVSKEIGGVEVEPPKP